MHILFLTDNFYPENNAPAFRTFDHMSALVKRGVKVTVITGCPNFPDGVVFKGYQNKLFQEEILEGIRVIRVWTYIAPNKGIFKRTIDFLSFMFSSFIAGLFVKKVDIIVGTSPQFFTILSAFALSIFKRKKFIFELRDIWPASIEAVGVINKNVLLRQVEKIELFLYRKARLIISVTESFKKNLVSRGISEDKIKVVKNGVNLQNLNLELAETRRKERISAEAPFVVGYIGTIGLAHGLSTVIQACALLRRKFPSEDIKFVLIGSGADVLNLRNEIKRNKLSNVQILEPITKSEIAEKLLEFDVGLVHLKASPVFTEVIPSKIFDYIASGLPILHGVKGESAKLILDMDVGITFAPESPEDLVAKLLLLKKDVELIRKLSRNGFLAIGKHDRQTLALELLDYIIEACEDYR